MRRLYHQIYLTIIASLVLVLLVVGAGRTVVSRMSNANLLEARTAEAAKQYVKTAYPKGAGEGQNLALPGTLQGATQIVQPAQITPTLTVRQGTSISIFVARDLDFTGAENRR